MAGWLAHWVESLEDKNAKIWRPRQVYTGSGLRPYVPLDKRPSARKPNEQPDKYIVASAYHNPFSKRTRAASWRNQLTMAKL